MKTLYTAIFAALLFTSQAQITLFSDWHAPQAGTTEGYKRLDSVGAIPKSTGAAQSWDFSGFTIASGTTSISYMSATTAPHGTVFTTANVAGNEGGDYTYYNSTATELNIVGMTDGTFGNFNFSNPKTVMKWPTAMATTFTDTYMGSTGSISVTGTFTSNATGHGTITLPGGHTFGNVLQIRQHDDVTLIGGGDTIHYMEHAYIYYWDNQRYPIVRIVYNDDEDGATATIEVNDLVALGISDYNFNANFNIYPNPAKDYVHVNLTNIGNQKSSMDFYSMTGQLVKHVDLQASEKIETNVSISDLAPGIYMVQTKVGDKTSTRKLIVD